MTHTSLITEIQETLTEAIKTSFPTVPSTYVEIARAKDCKFGDYQCNSAMKIAKHSGNNPRQVAEKIVEALPIDKKKLFKTITIAGPGFINLSVAPEYLAELLQEKVQSREIIPQTLSPQRVLIDFSSPNIAKEMHVGHLRSTIIGDCLSRVFEAMGHNVLRLNHVGDWGTAFGMLIAHIKTQPNFSPNTVSSMSLQDLMRLYKESKAKFDEDPIFRKASQTEVVRLQSGDPESQAIWKTICDISEAAYQQIYDLLDVKITVRGESFYNSMLKGVIDELEQKQLIEISEGAKCIYLDGFKNKEGNPLPLMLQKSDGGYNYDTTDMAAIIHRIRAEKANRIIYITDSGQATHFEMIFDAARKAKILDDSKVRVDHVPFGLVLGPDGKKFKTRSGETEKLIDLITKAVEHAKKILLERNPSWPEEEQEKTARILGIGAIKYSDLSSNRISDYTFSYDRMLRFEGNTAAFIMYSFVRSSSILRKIGFLEKGTAATLNLRQPSEISLAKILCQFTETLDEVIDTLLPNRLTDYLYTLAEHFNAFFRDCRVEGDEREQERALLVSLTNRTLKKGLQLLGIDVPQKM